jgi:hypothetical protein
MAALRPPRSVRDVEGEVRVGDPAGVEHLVDSDVLEIEADPAERQHDALTETPGLIPTPYRVVPRSPGATE